ncbi:MAG: PilZ domain-containing protein [Gemmataceae bacterium]|nr:PilZ domain-containing protein [Gemmataceae bacterium]
MTLIPTPVSPAPLLRKGLERRLSERHPCALAASCRAVTGRIGPSWSATVINISTGGMALSVGQHFAPGTLLAITVRRSNSDTPAIMLVRVGHICEQAKGEFVLGGPFVKTRADAN